MLNVIGSQASEFLVMLNQSVDFFTKSVDAFFIADHFYFAASCNQFEFGEIFSDHFQVAVINPEKFNRIKSVNWNNYFAQ